MHRTVRTVRTVRTGLAIILSVLIVLMCTGCNKKGMGILAKTPEINLPFQSELKLQAGALELNGEVKRYGMGIWELNVTSPETLAGLKLSSSDGGVKASLGELTLELPAEDVNEKAVFSLIFKAIDSAASADALVCTETADGKVFSGTFAAGEYTLTFDPDTLALTGISIPSAGINGEFTGFAPLTEKKEASSGARGYDIAVIEN